jgi:phosphoribosyl 1,2-cyclic phosphodiesterase
MATFTIHGARGSYPVDGAAFRRYGGSTSCFSLETAQGLLVVDAGTGIAALGDALSRRPALPPITILLTHLHLDHIIGIPSFRPLFRKEASVTFMADPACAGDWQGALTTVAGKPFWPVELLNFGAAIRFEDLPEGPLSRYGVRVTRRQARHPQGCLSYRLEADGRAIVIATDREHGDAGLDAGARELCQGADVLIHDAQYTPEEYAGRRGWGHSTWEHGARLAVESRVKRLILVSHDPGRSDEEVDRIVAQARAVFPQTIAGAEGMVVD